MVIFHSYAKLPEGIFFGTWILHDMATFHVTFTLVQAADQNARDGLVLRPW